MNRRNQAPGELLGWIGKAMVADADAARRALWIGLLNLLQGGGDKLGFEDERPRPWLTDFEHGVDGMFFKHLFARADVSNAEGDEAAWRRALVRVTCRLFEQAADRLSPPDCRRERAVAVATSVFWALLAKADLIKVAASEEQAS